MLFQSPNFDNLDDNNIFIMLCPIAPRHPQTVSDVFIVGKFFSGDHDMGKVQAIPVMYKWLEDSSYLNLLTVLRALHLTPTSIICDAKSTLKTAVQTVWRFASVTSSLYFFTLAMFTLDLTIRCPKSYVNYLSTNVF
ncbi:uncharacterized protein LOC127751364 [Frankliniella occidentalis]|uniref:Uncharacterized protein LOC127751364 n=1 Tax=Frankliniella occidentalis TaxID=133901 RepID=A0A9C6X7X1_FRAOC|nr:uncharacterized protein LOC127751364 [Frankliniella occidentalis]